MASLPLARNLRSVTGMSGSTIMLAAHFGPERGFAAARSGAETGFRKRRKSDPAPNFANQRRARGRPRLLVVGLSMIHPPTPCLARLRRLSFFLLLNFRSLW